jgi:plastocyanin
VRRAAPFAILAVCLGVGVLPAVAADQDVTIQDSSFTPSDVAVKPGESVTWRAQGATLSHNVHFEGEAAALGAPSPDFSATRQFPTAGTYRYYCDIHGSFGMRGVVFVNDTGTVPGASTPTPSPSGTPTPAPGAGYGGSTTGTAPATAPATVSAFRARAARSRFCARRTAACRRPGVFLLIDLSAPQAVRVRGTLRRGTRRVRSVSMLVRPGHRRVRLPGARLRPGRYALALRAADISRTVRFRVRRG